MHAVALVVSMLAFTLVTGAGFPGLAPGAFAFYFLVWYAGVWYLDRKDDNDGILHP